MTICRFCSSYRLTNDKEASHIVTSATEPQVIDRWSGDTRVMSTSCWRLNFITCRGSTWRHRHCGPHRPSSTLYTACLTARHFGVFNNNKTTRYSAEWCRPSLPLSFSISLSLFHCTYDRRLMETWNVLLSHCVWKTQDTNIVYLL